jgi:heme/copper-type cytochrome/quinol oxidase subunit 3
MSDWAAEEMRRRRLLPVGAIGRKTFGWWGMITVIMTEGALFAYLLFAYYYFAVRYGRGWIPEAPSLRLALPNTGVLLLSSVFVLWSESSARRGEAPRRSLGLAIAIGLGIIFLAIQLLEWREKSFTPASSSYGSSYFITTGFHMAHVAVGIVVLAALLAWSLLGYFDSKRYAALSIGALYWHFVDVVWLAIFFTFYLTPYLE